MFAYKMRKKVLFVSLLTFYTCAICQLIKPEQAETKSACISKRFEPNIGVHCQSAGLNKRHIVKRCVGLFCGAGRYCPYVLGFPKVTPTLVQPLVYP